MRLDLIYDASPIVARRIATGLRKGWTIDLVRTYSSAARDYQLLAHR
jgi:hypothetical protein